MTLVSFHLPSDYWRRVKALRLAVFVDEMGVPLELEIDEHDQAALHFAYLEGQEIVATLRILDNRYVAKIGRVAVAKSHRRRGMGTQLMQQAIKHCQQQSYQSIRLNAQIYITDFYAALGFQAQGDSFLDAGIPHSPMILYV